MKIIKYLLLINLIFFKVSYADINNEFEIWKKNFKSLALSKGISENTFNLTIKDATYLPNVIKYDRYQPEFYEDTKTYIEKRTSNKKFKQGIYFYQQNNDLINNIKI